MFARKMVTTALVAVGVFVSLEYASVAQSQRPSTEQSPTTTQQTQTKLSSSDRQFITEAAQGGMAEVKLGQLATKRAASNDVKKYAQDMIADHTKAGEGLKAALEKSNMTPEPPKLSPKHAAMVEQLKAASGEDFQMLYIDMQTQAHMEAVTLFRTYSGSGDDQNVVAFAKETLPTLEMHLMHVKELVAAH